MKWLCIFILMTGSAFMSAKGRMWTDVNGTQFEGTFSKELYGDALVEDLTGKSHFIPIDKLSAADLKYIQSSVPPVMNIEVQEQIGELPRTVWSRQDDITKLYTFDVTVKKISKLPYNGRLTAEIFIIANERAKERKDDCVLMAYKAVPFVFPPGERSSIHYTLPDVQFNAYNAAWITLSAAAKRGKTYAGYICEISDQKKVPVFFKTDIQKRNWVVADITNSVNQLRILYKNNPGSIESRHFDEDFQKTPPPRIPWFPRSY